MFYFLVCRCRFGTRTDHNPFPLCSQSLVVVSSVSATAVLGLLIVIAVRSIVHYLFEPRGFSWLIHAAALRVQYPKRPLTRLVRSYARRSIFRLSTML